MFGTRVRVSHNTYPKHIGNFRTVFDWSFRSVPESRSLVNHPLDDNHAVSDTRYTLGGLAAIFEAVVEP
jgi:hypothetical protein